MLPPSPLTVRTCRFLAYGSSRESFAHGGVAVDDPGSWERVPLQEGMEPIPWESAPSPRQPLLPDNPLGVPAKLPKVARHAVVGIVAGESDKGTLDLPRFGGEVSTSFKSCDGNPSCSVQFLCSCPPRSPFLHPGPHM